MDLNRILSAIAGASFGIWPIIMNRSGMKGLVSAAFFSLMCFLSTMPFALAQGVEAARIRWTFAITAGLVGAVGMLAFNTMAASATKVTINNYMLIVMATQTTVIAMNSLVENGWSISWQKSLGLALIIAGVGLFNR